jgi:DNA-binding response OmpR family regulator
VTRILIVDDSQEFRMMVERMLQHAGYETICAVDGEDGLRQTIVEHPDLILLDYMMPGMNGAEVFRELRENQNTAPIPVIMITAFSTQFESEQMADMRMMLDDFLTKPIMPSELASRIEKVLATRRIAGMQ